MAEERSWVSPYNFVQNNPILRIDPTGALDTKYEDEAGNLLLETNDGSDDIITASNDKVEDFKFYSESYKNNGMKPVYDSKDWNDNMKAVFLDFETIEEMESYLGNTSSQWSRQKLIDYHQYPTVENWIGFLGAEVFSQNANPLNHLPAPIKIKASPKLKVSPSVRVKTSTKPNPWVLFNKEMGKGRFMKENFGGSSKAASRARRAAYDKWKTTNGY